MSEKTIKRNFSLDKNPGALTHWIYDESYPLHSHAAITVVGGVSSGKSYFIYRRLLPIYIKHAGIKTILIAAKMGKMDITTSTELENPIYKDVLVEFIKINEAFEMCQKIRANAIINEYLLELTKVKNDKELMKIHKKLMSLIKSTGELAIIKEELLKLYRIVEKFMTITPEEVRDYATLLFRRGSEITYNPVIIVFDDMSGSEEFLRPTSDIHKLIYCRRHLQTTMIMAVQSLTTISTNIKRNTTEFVCFSTLSAMDVKALADRLPIQMKWKDLLEKFIEIAGEDERDKKMITIFTVFPFNFVVLGTPSCLKEITS